jgi:hypothetical protein
VKYKYRLFNESSAEFDFITLLVNPDSLRRRYAPRFSGWDSVGGDTTSIDIRDLVPNRKYVVVVVAFDEVGAYSPVMNLDVNMLFFTVSYAGLLGPTMTVYNESFYYTYPKGGFSLDPSSFIRTEVAAGPGTILGGRASSGSYVLGYCWMLDWQRYGRDRTRGRVRRVHCWSRWSPLTLGGLPAYDPCLSRSADSHRAGELPDPAVAPPSYARCSTSAADRGRIRLAGDGVIGGCVTAARRGPPPRSRHVLLRSRR